MARNALEKVQDRVRGRSNSVFAANDNAAPRAKVLPFSLTPTVIPATVVVPREVYEEFFKLCGFVSRDPRTSSRAFARADDIASAAVWAFAERGAKRPLGRCGNRSMADVLASLRALLMQGMRR